MTTLPEILKRLESREFDEPTTFKWAEEVQVAECNICCVDGSRWQFTQDQALIRTLIEVVRLQDEALGNIECNRASLGYAKHAKKARKRALTLLREVK